MADNDETTSSDTTDTPDSSDAPEPAPAGEEPEPPPAGEEPEPAPAGEEPEPPPAGEEPEPAPEGEEPPPAPSDADKEDSSGDDDDSSSKKKKSDSDSSSSDDSTSSGGQSKEYSEDDVQGALTSAFQMHGVPVDDDGIKVTLVDGFYRVSARLTAEGSPLPQIPEDTSQLAPGSVQGAMLMINGGVQILDGGSRVTLRIVSVETSEILQMGESTTYGGSIEMVQAAAEDALASLTLMHTT